MAPNRKKKKPAANPARGFATTSVVSKSKVEDQPPDEVEEATSTGVDSTQPGAPEVSETTAPREGEELSQLTAEQYEAHLEESELQLQVEKHGSKSKKESSRHIARLQTERRLLRNQAEPLDVRRWFSDELLQVIKDQINEQDQKPAVTKILTDNSVDSSDLEIRLWTLERVLDGLGFMPEQSRAAICRILQSPLLRQRASEHSGKDTLWGLEECLDWLSLNCDYDTLQTAKLQRQVREKAVATNDASSISVFSKTTTTPMSPEPLPVRNAPSTIMDREMNGIANELGDDDSDPDQFSSRYLHLMTRLYQIRPDLTLIKPLKKSNSRNSRVPTKEEEPLVRCLLEKIQKIESDILFDRDEANLKWAEARLRMQKEASDRRKLLCLGENTQKMEVKVNTDGSSGPSSPTDSDPDGSVMALGDFFSLLPEETPSGMAVSSVDGISIHVRDFGTWLGANPRRVFEDACKARDSLAKITYTKLSEHDFSKRYALNIIWSRAQDLPVDCPLSGFHVQSDSQTLRLKMTTTSTPSFNQSEAYISTVALFMIFVSSPKDGRAYLRLPVVWRDLWTELSDARGANIDSLDRKELLRVRRMVETHLTQSGSATVAKGLDGLSKATNRRIEDHPSDAQIRSIPYQQVLGAENIARLWFSKSSTAAYARMLQSRRILPIWSFKKQLLSTISQHQVVIVCGETGCGKSTQVPAFIIEDELSKGNDCRVYCTEPRRISAISLARRVSEELGESKNDVGSARSLVGYSIRLESRVTPQTRLVYATTGIVMRMLESDNGLNGITHLILDEVHERTIDSDFLLIVLRNLMLHRPALKVVLMSATVNAEQFSQYFAGAVILKVPGRTFPVDIKYLEDAIEASNYAKAGKYSHGDNAKYEYQDLADDEDLLPEGGKGPAVRGDLREYSESTRKLLAQFNEYRIDYELVVKLLEAIATNATYIDYSKAILVFLPGLAEIRRLNDMLTSHPTFSSGWLIYPLHSTIATEEQEKAFLVPEPGVRKIVMATNIAETGITIPDVTCVIDTGKHKEMRFDERRQLSRLVETFISRANAKQRRGRAGRVQNGLCFHLFTKARHDEAMAEQQTPEMLRLSLQDLVLRVKLCKLGSIEETLSQALDPPLAKNIRRAVDALIDVKALTPGEDLTPLGRQLAKLPLDVFLGKLIILGTIFKCVDACISIAAILSSKSPFSAPIGARAQADLARLGFKRGDSDLLTVYNAYSSWKRVCQTFGSSEFQFCRKYFLSSQVLSNIEDLKVQLTVALVDAGFIVLDDTSKESLDRARYYSRRRHFIELPAMYNVNSNNDLIIDSVIAWSFYPKLLAREGKGWRNVANNQTVSLHPTSVNKGPGPSRYLSFYHIMQSANKFYNAHETSAAEDFAIALVCGDADFRMFSGVLVLDGNRLRFVLPDWESLKALKALRMRIREIMTQSFKNPGRQLSTDQQKWFDIWQKCFAQDKALTLDGPLS